MGDQSASDLHWEGNMAAKSIFSTPKTPAYTAVEETTPGEVAAKPSVPLPHSKYQGKASIGEGVHVKGDVHDCSQVDVHGLMEGEIEADILIIHEKGRVKGVVKAGRGEIHGEVDGDVTISGRLEIRATGLVSGAVNYGELSVEAGGRITGQLEQRPDKSTEAQTPMGLDKSRVSN
jgi:cytoskeletal protein CcmA (bactofilin family)